MTWQTVVLVAIAAIVLVNLIGIAVWFLFARKIFKGFDSFNPR